jgi:hypothetical protein
MSPSDDWRIAWWEVFDTRQELISRITVRLCDLGARSDIWEKWRRRGIVKAVKVHVTEYTDGSFKIEGEAP